MAASPLPSAVPNAGDDLDALLSIDADVSDLFRPMRAAIDSNNNNNPSTAANTSTTTRPLSPKRPRPTDDDLGLGINEEIQVAKKRKPVAKLDDERLLSQAGIPKLRRISREKFKFKGKGHEFSDVARLLNLYQLWLDDLYPRAKFADGLAIIEKLGHSKRLGVMRREWMKEDEGKMVAVADAQVEREDGDREKENRIDGREDEEESLFVGVGNGMQDQEEEEVDLLPGDDDDLDALMAESQTVPVMREGEETGRKGHPDDTQREKGFDDQYSEEMRMMAEMENW